MRLWSLHPHYLDRQGLLALWRGLLAQKVLQGQTRGCRQHPQLARFQACPDPVGAVAYYLAQVADEAEARGYNFNRAKLAHPVEIQLDCPRGQLSFEWGVAESKLAQRSPQWLADKMYAAELPELHPAFRLVPGGKADWERG